MLAIWTLSTSEIGIVLGCLPPICLLLGAHVHRISGSRHIVYECPIPALALCRHLQTDHGMHFFCVAASVCFEVPPMPAGHLLRTWTQRCLFLRNTIMHIKYWFYSQSSLILRTILFSPFRFLSPRWPGAHTCGVELPWGVMSEQLSQRRRVLYYTLGRRKARTL